MITGTLGSNGWYTSDVSVTWTVNDNGSALTNTTGCGTQTVTTDNNAPGVTLHCSASNAGGTTTDDVVIKRDATKPTVTYSSHPASYTVDQTVNITCTAAYPTPGSGLASTTCANITGARIQLRSRRQHLLGDGDGQRGECGQRARRVSRWW